ncbi:MAG: hypothetical protein MAGBODY4_01139 [Candidatus Marinimicrobia bacterium]|nr:hypothetical protein [Candidatus Neomarinimicrobiota bacterium]
MNLINNDPVLLELRESKTGALLARHTLDYPAQGWNTWGLDSLEVKLSQASLLVVPINGDTNGVGYTSDNGPSGNSYFRYPNGGVFHPIENLTTGNKDSLLGDWSMRMQISYPGTGDSTNIGTWQHNPWIVGSEFDGTTITLTVKFQETGHLKADVYNILGQHVINVEDTFYDRPNTAYTLTPWDARNSAGVRVGSGVYFFTVSFKGKRVTKKITLLR